MSDDDAKPDEDAWAKPVERLEVSGIPSDALSRNVSGKRLAGALQGFGKLWQKTYTVSLGEIGPEDVIATWKRNYSDFWPSRDRLYTPFTTLNPGDVGVINSSQAGVTLSTGIMVVYSDDTSFAFMTPQGHPFAGWITFSAERRANTTEAKIVVLIRASDPLYELAFVSFASRREDRMWQHTLRSVADRFGSDADVATDVVCLDKKRQWHQSKNIWHNAAIRSGLYAIGAPFRWVAKLFRRSSSK